ncbi:nitrite reductase small subunit NirD [Paenibacillus farraposensis]|uniref:Nitrite reductase small subunit NirD n=1 Tax=Paenibacillus farraposensis TaxID=2807095 RepID=A0ABW4D7N5_9BACL|nr:nitrite reductase small subunit NirD [Paenibacillus farraposensis]MCC3379077.1 nitrite reductase small subunit NirD [Paenibacillus farraposensis]
MIKHAEWLIVGHSKDFPNRIGRTVRLNDKEIAVFRTSENKLYAVENACPHPKGGPLTEAIVSGHYIYDPLRDWKIDLETGIVQDPDTGQVKTFAIREDGEEVKISL